MDLLLVVHKFIPLVNRNVEVRNKILLTHHVGATLIEFGMEKENDFIITMKDSKVTFDDINTSYEYIVFVLTLLEIHEYSKDTDIFGIGMMKSYEKVTLMFSGLSLTFTFDSRMHIETDSFILDCVLKTSMSFMNAFDIMCCFHNIFSVGLIPAISTPSGLVFIFKYASRGKIRLRLIDRMRFELILDKFPENVFGDVHMIASNDMRFIEKLSNLYSREKLELVANAAKKIHKVSMNENIIHVCTSCVTIYP